MKSIWKGSISFGLVTIPVRLYSAVQEHAIGFTLLHNKCHTPIFYKRWCDHCKKEVAWADVVKGLKLESGSYAILTQEKLKALNGRLAGRFAAATVNQDISRFCTLRRAENAFGLHLIDDARGTRVAKPQSSL